MSLEQADLVITKKPIEAYSLKELIRGDIEAWQKQQQSTRSLNNLRAGQLIWSYAGLRAALIYRFSHHLWRRHVPGLPGMLTRLNNTLHGFDIPCTVPIGPGLYVPHPVGVVITAREIGCNVTLVSAITIGLRNGPIFPIIGDNVVVGAGARVLGDIRIGDNVTIEPNAVVVKDVPANSIATGVPAHIIAK